LHWEELPALPPPDWK